jgi:hypothetical protein
MVLESDLQPPVGSRAKLILHVHRQPDGGGRRATCGDDLCVVFDITYGSNDPGPADTGASGRGLTGSADTIAVAGFMSCSANARVIGACLRN